MNYYDEWNQWMTTAIDDWEQIVSYNRKKTVNIVDKIGLQVKGLS